MGSQGSDGSRRVSSRDAGFTDAGRGSGRLQYSCGLGRSHRSHELGGVYCCSRTASGGHGRSRSFVEAKRWSRFDGVAQRLRSVS